APQAAVVVADPAGAGRHHPAHRRRLPLDRDRLVQHARPRPHAGGRVDVGGLALPRRAVGAPAVHLDGPADHAAVRGRRLVAGGHGIGDGRLRDLAAQLPRPRLVPRAGAGAARLPGREPAHRQLLRALGTRPVRHLGGRRAGDDLVHDAVRHLAAEGLLRQHLVGDGDGRAGRRRLPLEDLPLDRAAPGAPRPVRPGRVHVPRGLGGVHPALHVHRLGPYVDALHLPAEHARRLRARRLRPGGRGGTLLRAPGGGGVPRRPALPARHVLRRQQGMTVHTRDGEGVPVSLRGLAKRFGKVRALRPLDLDIAAGELVAFLGPSGCGKTTTLLLIAGIYKADEGEVWFGDRRVDGLHPRDRDVGMVFQSYALYPHLTLFENI